MDFRGSIFRTVFYYFFSCGHGGIYHSHVKIEFGKNSKAKHMYMHIKTLLHLAGLVHLCVFIWKIIISPRRYPSKNR